MTQRLGQKNASWRLFAIDSIASDKRRLAVVGSRHSASMAPDELPVLQKQPKSENPNLREISANDSTELFSACSHVGGLASISNRLMPKRFPQRLALSLFSAAGVLVSQCLLDLYEMIKFFCECHRSQLQSFKVVYDVWIAVPKEFLVISGFFKPATSNLRFVYAPPRSGLLL